MRWRDGGDEPTAPNRYREETPTLRKTTVEERVQSRVADRSTSAQHASCSRLGRFPPAGDVERGLRHQCWWAPDRYRPLRALTRVRGRLYVASSSLSPRPGRQR